MAFLSTIPPPRSLEAVLSRLRDAAVGESLFSDQADLIGYLLSQGAPLRHDLPPAIRDYATLVLGAAATFVGGWSILPPGVGGDKFASIPTEEEWTSTCGVLDGSAWMEIAVWTGAEFTAQSALPLPFIPCLDDDSRITATARWQRLGTQLLAPAVSAYPNQSAGLSIPLLLRAAADDLCGVGARGALWEWNRDRRHDLVKALAQRDPSQVAHAFSLNEGPLTPEASVLSGDHASRVHPASRGIFSLNEWPLPPDVLHGASLFAVRNLIKKIALTKAAEYLHLQEFLVRSKMVEPGPYDPIAWEFSAITQTAPTDPDPVLAAEATRIANEIANRYSIASRNPSDYLKFRTWTLTQKRHAKNIAGIILTSDAKLVADWKELADAIRSRPSSSESDRAALRDLDSAVSVVGRSKDSLEIVRAALADARTTMDADQGVRICYQWSLIMSAADRQDVAAALLDLLQDAPGLSPASITLLSKMDLLAPHEIIGRRLRRRICGSETEGGVGTYIMPTQDEEESLTRVTTTLATIRGLYFVESRFLSIVEAGLRNGLCPDPELFEFISGFHHEGTSKGAEKETRALFALISAFDHERREVREGNSYVLSAIRAHETLHEARRALELSGQMSQTERTIRLIQDATNAPREDFEAGIAIADPGVLNVLNDANTVRACLAGVVEPLRSRCRKILHTAIGQYARGSFQSWKYGHEKEASQTAFAGSDVRELWRADSAWQTEALGIRLILRESSDFGELLRHGDFPVKTCQSLLAYGEKMEAGLAVLTDSHAKLLQFIDPSSRRIVGRSVVRFFQKDVNGVPVVVVESPYTIASEVVSLAMRMLSVRCLAEKFKVPPVEVVVGVNSKERESGGLHLIERHLGHMRVIRVVAPPTGIADHYVDSVITPRGIQQRTTGSRILDLGCFPAAHEMVRDCTHVIPMASDVCLKDPASLFTNAKSDDAGYTERCRKVFPDTAQRQAFFTKYPDARLSGTIPRGHEHEWRECLMKFPQLAGYLHHSETIQTVLGGAPNSSGDGRDVRGVLAIIEGRQFFRSMIHGLSKAEIAASKELWRTEISSSMSNDPDRWPPEIDYKSISDSVKLALPATLAINQAFSLADSRQPRGFLHAPSPRGVDLHFSDGVGF